MNESLNLPANRIHSIRARCIAMPLTRRQEQVVVAVGCALRSVEIAELTGLSYPTVGRHVALLAHRIFGGTDTLANRETLIIWALEHRECCTKNAWRRLAARELYADNFKATWRRPRKRRL